jgi:hypothetical protein
VAPSEEEVGSVGSLIRENWLCCYSRTRDAVFGCGVDHAFRQDVVDSLFCVYGPLNKTGLEAEIPGMYLGMVLPNISWN